MRNKITKEELEKALEDWEPEILFAARVNKDIGPQLVLKADAFRGYMLWWVRWFDKYDGLEHCVEFTDFASARDCFVEKVNETN